MFTQPFQTDHSERKIRPDMIRFSESRAEVIRFHVFLSPNESLPEFKPLKKQKQKTK